LEEVGGLDMVDQGREVEATFNRSLGTGRSDGGNVGLEAREHGVGGFGGELEEGGDNGDLVWIRY
jgi:hypothetical protein